MNTPSIRADELRALWQHLPTTPVTISQSQMHTMAERFQTHVRRRNRVEYSAWTVSSLGALYAATWPVSTMWSIALLVLVAGGAYAAFNLHSRGRPTNIAVATTAPLLDFHRAELTRQRDMLRGMWRWYLLPILPGFALFVVATWMALSERIPRAELVMGTAILILGFALVVGWTTVVQLSGAARLQRLIEDLERYRL